MPSARKFFTAAQQEDLRQAIMHAELDTSGEIRLHIEKSCPGEVLDRAAVLFGKLGMHKTALRNGVLFYLAVENRRFAILGDRGIDEKVPENFWEEIRMILLQHFRESRFTEGLCEGIRMAGEQLKVHFPYHRHDINELSDDISFDREGDHDE